MRCKNSAYGEVIKIGLDAEGILSNSRTHNIASGCNLDIGAGTFPINKRLNQRNFFVLPCPGWGVRDGILLKIKKFFNFRLCLDERISVPRSFVV